jgi:signal transduction histidine kinase/ActR/RegA family two-component response regulator
VLRLELARWFAGAQFITFFPAVIITTFICGERAGYLTVFLSALSAWLFVFVEEPIEEAASAVGFFIIVAIADVVIIGALRGAVARVHELNATLAEAKQVAETASQAKSEFLSSMGHELRTPLNAVIGYAELLKMAREGSLRDKHREYVGHIINGADHLLELVNDVLDLAGIEAGRLRLSIKPVSARGALEYVQRAMLPLAQGKGVTLDLKVPSELEYVRADELRLRQILMNLVSNAIKYKRAGGTVALTGRSTARGRVRFVVTDTGIGIAPERAKDLFQPFQRLGAEHSGIQGTGIGLALSRKLVEAMNGTIDFTSKPGDGSAFWIDLPAEASSNRAADAAQTSPSPSRATAGGYSLLYIEDDPSNIQLMEQIVATLPGVAMLAAPTPQLGIDLAAAHRPNVIVLDLNLPAMSGLEVLARLKAMPETRGIPVLALTAAAFPRDIRKGLEAGFFRYLTKPIDVNAFLAAVSDALTASSKRDTALG